MKKFVIRCDIEGVTGVTSYDQADPGKALYPLGKRMLENDLAAVCRGLNEGGADEILVYDEHFDGRNVDPEGPCRIAGRMLEHLLGTQTGSLRESGKMKDPIRNYAELGLVHHLLYNARPEDPAGHSETLRKFIRRPDLWSDLLLLPPPAK